MGAKQVSRSQFIADQIYHRRGKYRYGKGFCKAHDKLNVFCPTHGWFAQQRSSHDSYRSNHYGCPECGKSLYGRRERKESNVIKEFLSKGLQIESFNRPSGELKVLYKCTCGESHNRLVSNIRRGKYKCPDSRQRYNDNGSSHNKLDPDDVWLIFADYDCELLDKFDNSKVPLNFVCSCGRLGKKLLHNFKRNPWCAFCGKQKIQEQRITPNYIGLSSFKTYGKRLIDIGESVREGPNGEVQIRCYYSECRKWHNANKDQVQNKLRNSNTMGNGEGNIYCSDKCAEDCVVHGFNPFTMVDPDSKLFVSKTVTEEVRACAKVDRRELMRLQIDEFGHTYCDKCGIITNKIEHHHTQEVAKTGKEAITPAGHMLICGECHKEFTSSCRE